MAGEAVGERQAAVEEALWEVEVAPLGLGAVGLSVVGVEEVAVGLASHLVAGAAAAAVTEAVHEEEGPPLFRPS